MHTISKVGEITMRVDSEHPDEAVFNLLEVAHTEQNEERASLQA